MIDRHNLTTREKIMNTGKAGMVSRARMLFKIAAMHCNCYTLCANEKNE